MQDLQGRLTGGHQSGAEPLSEVEGRKQGDGSGGNVLATQAGGPEFGSSAPLEKARAVVCTCDPPVTHMLGRQRQGEDIQ